MIKFTISQFAKCFVKILAVSKSSLSTKFDRVHLGLKKYSQHVLRLSAVIFLFILFIFFFFFLILNAAPRSFVLQTRFRHS